MPRMTPKDPSRGRGTAAAASHTTCICPPPRATARTPRSCRMALPAWAYIFSYRPVRGSHERLPMRWRELNEPEDPWGPHPPSEFRFLPGCLGKAATPRRLGVMPRVISEENLSRRATRRSSVSEQTNRPVILSHPAGSISFTPWGATRLRLVCRTISSLQKMARAEVYPPYGGGCQHASLAGPRGQITAHRCGLDTLRLGRVLACACVWQLLLSAGCRHRMLSNCPCPANPRTPPPARALEL